MLPKGTRHFFEQIKQLQNLIFKRCYRIRTYGSTGRLARINKHVSVKGFFLKPAPRTAGEGVKLKKFWTAKESLPEETEDLPQSIVQSIQPEIINLEHSAETLGLHSVHDDSERPQMTAAEAALMTMNSIMDRRDKKQRTGAPPRASTGSSEDVLEFEAHALRRRLRGETDTGANGPETLTKGEGKASKKLPKEHGTELELDILELSSTGDGLAYVPDTDTVYVVPYCVPGDRVLAKMFGQKTNRAYLHLDFLKVLKPSPKREGVTPGCGYFSKCAGCQLQMLPYADQLAHKKTIVEKAFKNFSNLRPELIPPVEDTMGSPLQYGYRTKLTPHYDGNKRWQEAKETPPIGFSMKNRSSMIIDIEKCPIATPIINAGLHIERQKAAERLNQNPSLRRKGATILIRESTQRTTTGTSIPTSPSSTDQDPDLSSTTPLSVDLKTTKSNTPSLLITYPTHTDIKTYTSEHKALVTEYVNNFTFQTVANSFFQNNSSILPPFIGYVRQHCLPKSPGPTDPPVKYLLDAYCGSGLFAVCLSPLFNSVLGIDIDVAGVNAARANAEANGIPNAGFIAAEAEMIFADVPFPPDQSLVVIDPPRKGASVDFLTQLCRFGPKRVVYVSCNVHTQARDVGMLVQGVGEKWRYEIERLRGFDFFPQTGHVEGVCVLKRVEDERDGVVAGGREVEVETGKIFGATSAEELVEGGAEEKEIEEHGVGKLPGKREGWDENADPNASDKRDENGNTAV